MHIGVELSQLWGQYIFARKYTPPTPTRLNCRAARILRDICPLPKKLSKFPNFDDIFSKKINKISEPYMIFARKMPEFYIIFSRKTFFTIFFFWGGLISYTYGNVARPGWS